jgi:hypothetical protein
LGKAGCLHGSCRWATLASKKVNFENWIPSWQITTDPDLKFGTDEKTRE